MYKLINIAHRAILLIILLSALAVGGAVFFLPSLPPADSAIVFITLCVACTVSIATLSVAVRCINKLILCGVVSLLFFGSCFWSAATWGIQMCFVVISLGIRGVGRVLLAMSIFLGKSSFGILKTLCAFGIYLLPAFASKDKFVIIGLCIVWKSLLDVTVYLSAVATRFLKKCIVSTLSSIDDFAYSIAAMAIDFIGSFSTVGNDIPGLESCHVDIQSWQIGETNDFIERKNKLKRLDLKRPIVALPPLLSKPLPAAPSDNRSRQAITPLVASSYLSAPALLDIQSASDTQLLGFQGRPRRSALNKTKKNAKKHRIHIQEEKNEIKYTYSNDYIRACFPGWMEDLDDLVDNNCAEIRYVNFLLNKWEDKMRYLPQHLCKKLALKRGALYHVIANAKEAKALDKECKEAYEAAQYAARLIQCWYEVEKDDKEEEEHEEVDFDNQEVADAEFEQEALIDNEVFVEEPVVVQEPKKKGKKRMCRALESTLDGKAWAVSGRARRSGKINGTS